jgi:ATP-dependent DNA ligase
MIKYPPKPMRGWAGTSLHQRLIDDPEWIAEPKKNGERCILQVGKNEKTGRSITLWSRRCIELKGVAQSLVDILRQMVKGVVYLDGELVKKGCLWLFDIPNLPLPLQDRRSMLVEWYDYRTCKGDRELVKLMPWIPKETAYKNSLEAGDEGVVFKNVLSLYRPQPEPDNEVPVWVKFKPAEKW